jgi:hypothetical protein
MIKIDKFLWHHLDNHDKYWGWILLDTTYYNFWGKRGAKKPTFKRYPGEVVGKNIMMPSKLRTLYFEKLNKGYKDYTDPVKIERFFPNFLKNFEIQLTMAKLVDDFHAEKD